MSGVSNKVLVVDDDPGFHRLVESVLVPTGVPVHAVRTGEEALKLLHDGGKPIAMIIDGLLPGARGDDIAYRVRQKYAQGELPILFVSAFFRDVKSRQRLMQNIKVDAMLHKPVSVEDLKRALSRFPGLTPAPEASVAPEIELELDITTAVELLTDFLVLATERIDNMRAAMTNLGQGKGEEDALKMIRLEAHRFRGTGTSFGLPEVTRLGGQMEDLIERHKFTPKMPPEAVAALSGMLEALEVKLMRAGATLAAPGTAGSSKPLKVMVIDGPGDLAISCGEAIAKGVPLRLFSGPEEGHTAALEDPPDVIFLAADRPAWDALDECEAFRKAGHSRVVLMAEDGSFGARLEAQKRGALGYVHRLPDAASLLSLAREFAPLPRGMNVLVVSPNHDVLGSLAETLLEEKLHVTPCTEPRELFDALDEADPALLMISSQLPGVNGLSLVRAVRADARYTQLPILVLAKSDARNERLEAFDAGADDVVPAPINGSELRARVKVMVRRRAREKRRAGVAIPGFPDVEVLKEEMHRAVVLARRGRTLAVLAFEGKLDPLHKAKGRMSADQAVATLGARLKQAFRTSDVVAHLGNARFGVLLHDVARADAARLLEDHLKRFNEGGPFGDEAVQIAVRGGLATFPEVRGGAEALLEAALFALGHQSE